MHGSIAAPPPASQGEKLEVLLRLGRRSLKYSYCCVLGVEAGSISASRSRSWKYFCVQEQKLEVFLRLGVEAGSMSASRSRSWNCCVLGRSWKYCSVLVGDAGSIAASWKEKLEVLYHCVLGVDAGSFSASRSRSWWYGCVLGGEAGSISASQEETLEVLLCLWRRSWKYFCVLGGEDGSISASRSRSWKY